MKMRVHRSTSARRHLVEGLQRIMVLQSIASVSEQKIDALEPQETFAERGGRTLGDERIFILLSG